MYNGHSENQVVLTHMSIMIHVYIYEEYIHTSRYTVFTLHSVSPQNINLASYLITFTLFIQENLK